MANPTARDLHVDQLLTNILISYSNQNYIADQIFPIVPVNKQSGLIPQFDQSPWFRAPAKKDVLRAPRTRSKGGDYTVNTSTYYCPRYSWRHEIDDEQRDTADSVWNLDSNGTRLVANTLQLYREVQAASTLFTTSVWNDDETGGTDFTRWDNYATATPLVDATTYMDEVEGRIGVEANTLVLGKPVFNSLKWHPDLIETIKYTQNGTLTEDLIKTLFGVDKLLIGRALQTTDPEGTAEASVTYTRIWGKHALFLYVPDNPSLNEPAAGYTFTWARVPGSLQYVVRYRDDERETDIIEGNSYFTHAITAARAGTFLSGVVA